MGFGGLVEAPDCPREYPAKIAELSPSTAPTSGNVSVVLLLIRNAMVILLLVSFSPMGIIVAVTDCQPFD